jgi:hypothetical protein
MTLDTELINARKQGWNDGRKYVAILKTLSETENNYLLYGSEKIKAILDECDIEIKKMEEIYGESFVIEYKDERKELTLLEEGD